LRKTNLHASSGINYMPQELRVVERTICAHFAVEFLPQHDIILPLPQGHRRRCHQDQEAAVTKWYCFVLVVLASTQLLFADSVNPPFNLNLSMGDCSLSNNCFSNTGFMGSPATAYADFSLINEPFTFNLQTGDALTYTYDPVTGDYSATFGLGGFFDMTGPNGLTFTGVVTSGSTAFTFNSWNVDVTYSGQWSDGQYATGTADVSIGGGGIEGAATLTQQDTVPEPGSFILLGSGLLGALGLRRKLFL
jgi:hypothetical protein